MIKKMESKCCQNPNLNYSVTVVENTPVEEPCCSTKNKEKNKCLVYCPLIITFLYIIGGAIISQYPFQPFDYMKFLSIIMGLFLVSLSYLLCEFRHNIQSNCFSNSLMEMHGFPSHFGVGPSFWI